MDVLPSLPPIEIVDATVVEDDDVIDEDAASDSRIMFHDPVIRVFLKAYLIKSFQEESIIFWEMVKELELLRNKIPNQKKIDYVQEIYDKFIKDGSEMEININASMKKMITSRLKKFVLFIIII